MKKQHKQPNTALATKQCNKLKIHVKAKHLSSVFFLPSVPNNILANFAQTSWNLGWSLWSYAEYTLILHSLYHIHCSSPEVYTVMSNFQGSLKRI